MIKPGERIELNLVLSESIASQKVEKHSIFASGCGDCFFQKSPTPIRSHGKYIKTYYKRQ